MNLDQRDGHKMSREARVDFLSLCVPFPEPGVHWRHFFPSQRQCYRLNQTTFLRANRDRIVLDLRPQGWQVRYYRPTSVRGSWLRRLLGRPPVFEETVSSPMGVHALLLRRGVPLTRAEMQRLNSMMDALQAQVRQTGRQPA